MKLFKLLLLGLLVLGGIILLFVFSQERPDPKEDYKASLPEELNFNLIDK